MQVAESQAQQLHQEALALSPAESALQTSLSASPAAAKGQVTPAPAASPALKGQSSQPLAPSPALQASDSSTSAMSLPAARLLAKVFAAKAGAFLAAGKHMANQQNKAAGYAVPGRDAAVVKKFLAQAGMLVSGAECI